jgi:hypothetical protein
VLAEGKGLHHHFADQGVPRLYPRNTSLGKDKRPRSADEANQLKYTCHQLWKETKGYGLRFNTLYFRRRDSAHPHATQQAIAFLQSVSEQNLKSIRAIDISQSRSLLKPITRSPNCCSGCGTAVEAACPSLEAELRRTVWFLQHAHVYHHIQFNVDITLPCGLHAMPPCAGELMLHVVRHFIAYRGMLMYVRELGFSITDSGLAWLKKMQFDEDPQVLNAPNVRFRIPQGWYSTKLIRWDFRHVDWLRDLERDSEGGVDEFVDVIQEWYEDGF